MSIDDSLVQTAGVNTRDDALRAFTQEDMLASTLRVSLGLLGPVGTIVAEFLTQFVPRQRIDRLHDWVEQLNDRMSDVEARFRERLANSPAYATLAEAAAVAAVESPSDARRKDLAALLRASLSQTELEIVHSHALLGLLTRLNDPELLILVNYGGFRGTLNDPEHEAFLRANQALFVNPPSFAATESELRQWTMYQHYENELVQLGLLRDTEGIAKSGPTRRLAITTLGGNLLAVLGRAGDAAKFAT